MNKLNELVFSYNYRKIKAQHVTEKKFVNYQQARKFLILYEYNWLYKDQDIQSLCAQLIDDGKTVEYCNYDHAKKSFYLTGVDKSFSEIIARFRKPPVNIVNYLSENEYDIIIDLSMTKCLPLQYTMLYANASCVAGHKGNYSPELDFIVEIPPIVESEEQLEELTEENKLKELTKITFQTIIYYLKAIKSKDN